MRLISCVLTAVTLASTNAAAQELFPCDPGEVVVKFSHVTAETDNPKGYAATELAERVNTEMDGRMCMIVFPNSALFDDERVIEAVLIGDVQLAAPSLSRLEEYTEAFRLFDLFFLFDDIEHVDRFQQSEVGQDMLASLEQFGLVGLTFWHSGMKQMSATRPLVDPRDMHHLTMRIQPSDVLERSFSAFGATPQKLPFSEVHGALASGAVEGQENTWSNIYSQRFFEHQNGITASNHGVLDYVLLVSADFWFSLEPGNRAQFQSILNEVTAKYNALAGSINDQARATMIAQGVVVRELTAWQRQRWIDLVQPLWSELLPDEKHYLIDAALAVREPN